MNPELLKCIPIRYLCPFCGKWHKWEGFKLIFLQHYPIELKCLKADCIAHHYCYYTINFDDKYCNVFIGCMYHELINSSIPISSIIESINRPIVMFEVTSSRIGIAGEELCLICPSYNSQVENLHPYTKSKAKCALTRLDARRDRTIKLGFEFSKSDYDQFSKVSIIARKEKELKEREKAIAIKEQSLRECEQTINKI